MRIMTTLACMELSGIGVNLKSLQELSSVVSNEMQSLETKAYDLAGRKFNFSSSKEVGQVCKVKILYILFFVYIYIYSNIYTYTHCIYTQGETKVSELLNISRKICFTEKCFSDKNCRV